MTDLTPSEETAYGIIGMLGNDVRFRSRMDELTKARKDAEDAEASAAAAVADLAKKRSETDAYVKGRQAELEAKQKQHDTAAAEAAQRIALATSQANEALKVQNDNKTSHAALALKEQELAGRERFLTDQQAGISVRLAEIDRKASLLNRQLAHIAAMPKQ